MQFISNQRFRYELKKRNRYLITICEFYDPKILDFTSIEAPKNAFGRFSPTALYWQNQFYEGRIASNGYGETTRISGEEFNRASITFNNLGFGKKKFVEWLETNRVEGARIVERIISPNAPNGYFINWWGRVDEIGEIGYTVKLDCYEEGGHFDSQMPFRDHRKGCLHQFGDEYCICNQSLEEKSVEYQNEWNLYGVRGCPQKDFENCTALRNQDFFGGRNIRAVEGNTTWTERVDTGKKWWQFWKKRYKTETHSLHYSSRENSNDDTMIPEGFGLIQSELNWIQWVDTGTIIKALGTACEGEIAEFTEVRSRTNPYTILNFTGHKGECGNTGSQLPDTRFPNSGTNSRVALIGVDIGGSTNPNVDDAPLVSFVSKARIIHLPDENGKFTKKGWSDNAIAIWKFIENHPYYGRGNPAFDDDEDHIKEMAECDDFVLDSTQSESLILDQAEASQYGATFRHFRPTSTVTPVYIDTILGRRQIGEIPVEFQDPNINFGLPDQPITALPKVDVLRRKYTLNWILREKNPVRETINKELIPACKGYKIYSSKGKIQRKIRKQKDYTYIRQPVSKGSILLPVVNTRKFLEDQTGFIIIGVGEDSAEVRKIKGIRFTRAGNGIPFTVEYGGGLTAEITNNSFSGGDEGIPSRSTVKIEGVPSYGGFLRFTIGEGEKKVVLSYYAQSGQSLESVVAYVQALFNAHPTLKEFLRAFEGRTLNEIDVNLYYGFIELDKPIEFNHVEGEEILRVVAIFENCNSFTKHTGYGLNNILDIKPNVKKWDRVNTIKATFTNILDDFAPTPITPRHAHEMIAYENREKPKTVSLRAVGNEWQAGYLVNGEAIRYIDGNFHVDWKTTAEYMVLDQGDVVAIYDDSKTNKIMKWIPIEINEANLNPNNFEVSFSGNLYHTIEFDTRVRNSRQVQPTSLVTNPNPQPVPAIGGAGYGIGGYSESNYLKLYKNATFPELSNGRYTDGISNDFR